MNPDPRTNPVNSLEDFYVYLDWTECPLPWEKMSFAQSSTLTETIDQAMAYFYFLLDQPLEELEGRGTFRPVLEYEERLRPWINQAVAAWGTSLDRAESWNETYRKAVWENPEFHMEMGWYEDPSNWHSFNEFFSRRLRDGNVRRAAAPGDDSAVVSPADSEFQGVWDIDENSLITDPEGIHVKSRTFRSVQALLGEDSAYGGCFAGGKMTHSFLGITDYHRYHFPVSGIVREIRVIPALDAAGGIMYWDAPRARYNLELGSPEWQAIETRGCVIVETAGFGNVAILPIGMCEVSSVSFRADIRPGMHVVKGEELGHFLYGGSDFMLIFEKRADFEYLAGPEKKHLLVGEVCGKMKFTGTRSL